MQLFTHIYQLKLIPPTGTSIEDKHKAMDFASKIGQLKKLRIKADYKEEDIDYPHSCKALELAKEVRSILKSFKYDSV